MDQANANLLAFILSGRATFTVTSAKTGSRFTYRVQRRELANCTKTVSKPGWFVSVLTGPDNTADYAYMGMVLDYGEGSSLRYGFSHTRGSKVAMDAPSFKGFAWLLRRLQTCGLGDAATVDHMGRCGRCGRALTVPESIRTGLGPECAKRAGGGA